ncbi:hypothetical protein [Streptomyces umbrinus]|uniref:hypothetical protein n=1 Tax=Streptomyces umbrinus TaxID=67370 RepID=UPI003C2E088B
MDMPDNLSESEQRVVAGARQEMVVDFRTDDAYGPNEAEQWSEDRRVRAVVIAALVSGADALSRFTLCGVRITGDLDLANARLQTSLLFEHCVFDGKLLLAEATTRSVRLRGCYLSHINAARIILDGELEVAGCRLDKLSLYGARTGDVEISGSTFTSPNVAVQGDLAAIDGAFYCHDAVIDGQLRLPGAHIKGYAELDGSTIRGGVLARNLEAESGMYCRLGYNADRAACAIGGDFDLRGARIKRELRLDNTRLTVLDLRQAQVDSLCDDPAHWPRETRLDGLRYEDLAPGLPAGARLDWLSRGRNDYQPQPLEQLAAHYRRIGHDEDARRVLLHKQRERRRTLAPPGRTWGLVQDLLVGYGYRPWLAGLWLLVLLAAGTVFFAATPLRAARDDPPPFSAPAYTLDLLLPVVNLGQETAWSPHGPGQTVAYGLIVAGWILATAVIAGITRQLVHP